MIDLGQLGQSVQGAARLLGTATLGRKLKYSINPDLIDRNEGGDNRLYTRGWVNTEGTAADLARTVKSGVAYSAQLSGPRRSANFRACDIASVDIDGSMTIGEALAHPLVAQHATMIYTTTRHTAHKHRFRLVFALARTIESPREMEALARSLSRRLSGDQASTDATRLFFGNRAAEIELFDREIGEELIEELIAQSWNTPVSSGASGADRLGTIRSRHTVSPELAIDFADGRRLPFCDVAIGTSIRCPFHHDADPSAFVLQSLSGTKGIHCSACHETFWSGGEDDHDFEDFDRAARKARERFDAGEEQIVATAAEAERDYGPLSPVIALPYYRKKLIACGIDIVTGTPAPPDLRPGLNFIKSAKGTGKTEALKDFSRSANLSCWSRTGARS